MIPTRESKRSPEVFTALLGWFKLAYKRVTFLVENNNFKMLKIAMNFGFTIIGVRNFKGHILLEHGLEFTEGT